MKRITIILVSLLFSQFITAQVDTLPQHYRRMAVEYQQRIKMAEHQLSGAESQLKAANSDRLPSLDFNSRYRFSGVPLQQAPSSENPTAPGEELQHLYSLNLDLYQPVVTGGYLKNTKKAAESEVEKMKSILSMSKQDVVLNSDKLYWVAVAKKETYNLQVKYKEIIGQFLKVIKDRVDEEVVGRNELYQAMVRYNNAEYRAIQSQKEYEVSVMNLNIFVGLPSSSPANVADSLLTVTWMRATDTITQYALSQRPEISFIKSEIQKNQYYEKVVRSKYLPQLGVTAGGKWGSPSPGLEITPGFNYYLKAQLVVPIFQWSKKHEEVFAIRQMTEVAKLQMEETADQVTREVETSYYKLQKSQELVDFAKSSMNNAAKNVSVMLDRYNEGLSSVLEVLDAQLDWQKTYFNYIISKYQLNVAYSEYQYAIGEFSK
ncbi:MAG: TolC family protein [Chlorobi bacterium]|nr:TolC family protein [Chlorobiota bacterium]